MYQIMCQPRVLPVVRKEPRKGAPRCHRLRRSRTGFRGREGDRRAGLGRGLSPSPGSGGDRGRGSVARQPRWRSRARSPQRRLPPQPAERAIELKVTRTRRPVSMIGSYARRAPEIDRAILAGFVPGLSTRKVGETFCSAARLRRQPLGRCKAVACLRDDLLTCFQDPDQRRQVSTLSSDGSARSGPAPWALSRPR